MVTLYTRVSTEEQTTDLQLKAGENNHQWGRKGLADELQQMIKELIAAKKPVRNTAKLLKISIRTGRKEGRKE